MKYLEWDNTETVIFIHYQPELLSPERKVDGVEVEDIPEPEEILNRVPVLCVHADTKVPYYRYEEQTPVEPYIPMDIQVADLKKQLETLSQTIAQMQIEGEK